MEVELIRTEYEDKQTTGELVVYNEKGKVVFNCKTLELDIDGNKEGESAIPNGSYDLIPLTDRPDSVTFSKQNYGYFPYLVKDVPNRSGILIHHGNFFDDILGCILVGDEFTDINADGYMDVTNSIDTMKELNQVLTKPAVLTVRGSTVSHRRVPESFLTR